MPDRYHQPGPGSLNWNDPLNENFANLDIDVEHRGADADKSGVNPADGAMYRATDTGTIYLGDGANWAPAWDLGNIGADSHATYVADYAGADLSAKLQNALDDLPGGMGRVVVTPPADGTFWSWDTNLTINPNNYNGIHIDIELGTRIQYEGSGVVLTFDTGGNDGTQSTNGNFVKVTGGRWISGSGDPTACFQLKDCYRTILEPSHMQDWRNTANDAACISVENHASWSEDAKIRDARFDGDIGIDFKGASITGGTGTESFVNTHVENCTFNCDGPGLRLRGAFNGSVFINNEWFVRGDGQDLVFLEGDASSATFIGPRFDNVGSHLNTTPFHFGVGYTSDSGPVVMQPKFNQISTQVVDDSGNNIRTPLFVSRNAARLGLLGENAYFEIQDGQFNWAIGGNRVANIDGTGNLRIAGTVTESDGTL